MSAPRPYLPDALQSIAPWIAATAALLVAIVILSQFIDTLHVSIQRGEALRSTFQAQNIRAAPALMHLADSATRSQTGSR